MISRTKMCTKLEEYDNPLLCQKQLVVVRKVALNFVHDDSVPSIEDLKRQEPPKKLPTFQTKMTNKPKKGKIQSKMAIGGNQVGKNMSTDARVKNGMSKGSKNSMQSKIIGFATRKIKNRAPRMTKLNTISIKSSTIDQPCPQTDSKPPAEMIQRNGDSAQTDSKPPAETNQKNKNGAKTDSKTPADMIQGNENCAKTDPKPPADMIQRNENGTKTDLKPLAETIQRNANQSGSNPVSITDKSVTGEMKKDYVMILNQNNPLKFVIKRSQTEIKQEPGLHDSGYQEGNENADPEQHRDLSLSQNQSTLMSDSSFTASDHNKASFVNPHQASFNYISKRLLSQNVANLSFNSKFRQTKITPTLSDPTIKHSAFGRSMFNQHLGKQKPMFNQHLGKQKPMFNQHPGTQRPTMILRKIVMGNPTTKQINTINPASPKIVIQRIPNSGPIVKNPPIGNRSNTITMSQALSNQKSKMFVITPSVLKLIPKHNLINTSTSNVTNPDLFTAASKNVFFNQAQTKPATATSMNPSFNTLTMKQEIKTEIKEEHMLTAMKQEPLLTAMKQEPMLTAVKQEPYDDYWPVIPQSQSEVELDAIMRRDIKKELLPFDIQEKLELLKLNEKPNPPPCGCIQTGARFESFGIYYNQLGFARTLPDVRAMMEKRTGVTGKALRIEQAVYCNREGRSRTGCPVAKEVIKRSSLDEKFLVVVKKRDGHSCEQVYMVMGIIVWEGIPRQCADKAYSLFNEKIPKYGLSMERHCEANNEKTCACQGLDPNKEGLSYSFGCSWNCYHNLCKFAKSSRARKYHLSDKSQEEFLESQVNELADICGPLLERIAPDAFFNMTVFNSPENRCRIGTGPIEKRPFSGTSTVIDFCAHAHHDVNNMNNGTTMVVTLLKPENRQFGQNRSDRQLHVLPNYRTADVDEYGSREGQLQKVKSGAIEILDGFHRTYAIRKFRKVRPKCSRSMGMSVKKKRRITTEMMAEERQKMYASMMQKYPIPGNSNCQPSVPSIPQLDGSFDLEPMAARKSPFVAPSIPGTSTPAAADDSVTFYTHDNSELFGIHKRDVGGLAFELEHGAVLIESAKHENHATTALINPDRHNPTRIGLVFYQHKSLIYPNHGNDEIKTRETSKMERYYKLMQRGDFIPTERQLRVMLDQGFKFPETVLVAPPRKPRDGSGHELPLDIISSTHGCYFIKNPSLF